MELEKQNALVFEPDRLSTWGPAIKLLFKSPQQFFKAQTFYYPIALSIFIQFVLAVGFAFAFRMRTSHLPTMSLLVGVAIAVALPLLLAAVLTGVRPLWDASGSFRKYLSLITFVGLLSFPINMIIFLFFKKVWIYLLGYFAFVSLGSMGFFWRFRPGKKRFILGLSVAILGPFVIALGLGVVMGLLDRARQDLPAATGIAAPAESNPPGQK